MGLGFGFWLGLGLGLTLAVAISMRPESVRFNVVACFKEARAGAAFWA